MGTPADVRSLLVYLDRGGIDMASLAGHFHEFTGRHWQTFGKLTTAGSESLTAALPAWEEAPLHRALREMLQPRMWLICSIGPRSRQTST
jgi:hypothetical protein